jgi:hypothetical protein
MSAPGQAPLKAQPLYFSPVSPSHPAGKEGYGRYMLCIP